MKRHIQLQKDHLITRAIIGLAAFLIISILAIEFNNEQVLWALALVPSCIKEICK